MMQVVVMARAPRASQLVIDGDINMGGTHRLKVKYIDAYNSDGIYLSDETPTLRAALNSLALQVENKIYVDHIDEYTGGHNIVFLNPPDLTTGVVGFAPAAPTAGTIKAAYSPAERTHTGNTTYTRKAPSWLVARAGVYRIGWEQKKTGGIGSYVRPYVNGAAAGDEQYLNSTTYTAYTQDLTLARGDRVTLYQKPEASGDTCYVKEVWLGVAADPVGALVPCEEAV